MDDLLAELFAARYDHPRRREDIAREAREAIAEHEHDRRAPGRPMPGHAEGLAYWHRHSVRYAEERIAYWRAVLDLVEARA